MYTNALHRSNKPTSLYSGALHLVLKSNIASITYVIKHELILLE